MSLTSKFPLLVSEELRRLNVRRQEEHRAERDDNRGNALEDEYPPPARLAGDAVHFDNRSGQQTWKLRWSNDVGEHGQKIHTTESSGQRSRGIEDADTRERSAPSRDVSDRRERSHRC